MFSVVLNVFLFCVFIFFLVYFSFSFYCVPCVRFHNKYIMHARVAAPWLVGLRTLHSAPTPTELLVTTQYSTHHYLLVWFSGSHYKLCAMAHAHGHWQPSGAPVTGNTGLLLFTDLRFRSLSFTNSLYKFRFPRKLCEKRLSQPHGYRFEGLAIRWFMN